ncbi:hypothetical protein [Actinomadura litoris]|nr:hypothetical protein [Actinomadura litoris]
MLAMLWKCSAGITILDAEESTACRYQDDFETGIILRDREAVVRIA